MALMGADMLLYLPPRSARKPQEPSMTRADIVSDHAGPRPAANILPGCAPLIASATEEGEKYTMTFYVSSFIASPTVKSGLKRTALTETCGPPPSI